ncbi:MAG: FKBP-type peptidyl-prolyl cis-trans isomerase [Bacteroidia bacterium]|nr:FKBP-type peptidyl-prolyl cis-trans isomerase [Bacteroidia bacterium]
MKITALSLFVFLLLSGCVTTGKMITTSSGLNYTILSKGKGPAAKDGDEVAIYETTRYRNGTLLYGIERPSSPLKFIIGKNQVIEGVEEGVQGMRAGEIRQLIVPPSLSKRTSYPPTVSPDSILVYKIELVEIL